MLATEELTDVPEEQTLIGELNEGLSGFYREDLPHHNYRHAHDEVLPEVLRLDELQPTTRYGRLKLIAAALIHDAGSYLPLDPADGMPKEQRSVELTKPLLRECGFRLRHINEIDDMVQSTGIGTSCWTPDEIKLRRADIANVAGKRMPFLATTVNIFYEEVLLADEYNYQLRPWSTYIIKQAGVLKELLSQDLSLGDERVSLGMGPFNRAAMKNVSLLLSKTTIRNPSGFVSKYGHLLRPFVAEKAIRSITRAVS